MVLNSRSEEQVERVYFSKKDLDQAIPHLSFFAMNYGHDIHGFLFSMLDEKGHYVIQLIDETCRAIRFFWKSVQSHHKSEVSENHQFQCR
jgi:hypothetical protein